jgi:hypothetical protein
MSPPCSIKTPPPVATFTQFSTSANFRTTSRADLGPLCWAPAHVPLGDPRAVADLVDRMQEAGAEEQLAALLHRDPAAHASLGDPLGLAWLLDSLREAGTQE